MNTNNRDADMHFVLNLAPTGMVMQRSDTPAIPLSEEEIVSDVLACRRLGATCVHLHARAEDGQPSNDSDRYARIIEGIRAVDDEMVLCVSCSGRLDPSFNSRAQVLDLDGDLKPDMASLTPSSLNFPRSASVNQPDTVRRLAERMTERGIKPEIEIFDLGMLNYTYYLIEKGALEPPYYFNIILGNIASAQMDPLHLGVLLKELPEDSIWSVGGIGRTQLPANTLSLSLGGGVRIGLEDNIWFDDARTDLANNTRMVERIVEIGQLLGRRPMPAAKLRQRLVLRTGFGQ